MAIITAEFADIKGESTLAGYEDQIDAVSIFDSIEMPLAAGSGRTRSGRSSGVASHSDIQLTTFRSLASAKLSEAVANGTNVGDVTINVFRMLEAGLVPYMTYRLTDVYVSRLDLETVAEDGSSFYPYLCETSNNWGPPNSWGAAGAASSEIRKSSNRFTPIPVAYRPALRYSNQVIDRVFLNPATVVWEFNQFTAGVKSGTVAKGWDIQRNTEATA